MLNGKNEITKRRNIRKTLLLKVNEEIKNISKSNLTFRINSQTIQEIEQKYNRNNILLSEKGIVYYNYIKTGIKIFPLTNIPKKRIKSVEKKIEKSKKELEIIGSSFDGELSPIINFCPKKIDFASKLLIIDKRYTKNNGSIQKFIKKNLNSEESLSKEEDKLNKTTKIENNNLHKLIEKILIIKDNENMEKKIKKNIKKLRKYCYRFRIKKKKIKRLRSQEHKKNIQIKSSNNLIPKVNGKEKEKKSKFALHFSSKKQKTFLSIKKKRNTIKLKSINNDNRKKIFTNLNKMIFQKPVNTFNKNEDCKEVETPYIFRIQKELTVSAINETPSKFDIRNCLSKTNIIKPKPKNIKNLLNKKKLLLKNTSLFQSKDIEKLNFSNKNNINERIILNDNSLHKSNKKIKRMEINKTEKKKNNLHILIHKINNNTKRKSKNKSIDTSFIKNDINSTNYYTNIFNVTQSTDEKINKRKSYKII